VPYNGVSTVTDAQRTDGTAVKQNAFTVYCWRQRHKNLLRYSCTVYSPSIINNSIIARTL